MKEINKEQQSRNNFKKSSVTEKQISLPLGSLQTQRRKNQIQGKVFFVLLIATYYTNAVTDAYAANNLADDITTRRLSEFEGIDHDIPEQMLGKEV